MRVDAELLRRYAVEHSEAAFTELIRRNVDLVYSAALRLVNGDAHRAQDVTQQAFTEFARQAKHLLGHPAPVGWLYTTTRLAALRTIRTEQRRTAREREATTMNELLREPAPEPDWDRVRPVLEHAMHELRDKDRHAVLLRFFQNKSLKEVGMALGLGENAARMRVERALEKLRAKLVRRGITTTAAALSAAISVNAVQVAPAGLAATVSGASLAGAATGTATTLPLLRFMATAKLQTTVIIAILVASLVTPLLVQHRAGAKLRQQAEALRRQTERRATLQAENQRLSLLLAADRKPPTVSNDQFRELLRLRGQVGRLRTDVRELAQAKTGTPVSRHEMLADMARLYSERVSQLKQLLETHPAEKIPELRFLTAGDWLWLAQKEAFDTEDGSRHAMSMARLMGEQNPVADELHPALQRYAKDHSGQFPSNLAQLEPYFGSAIDEATLQRWEVVPKSALIPSLQAQLDEDWYLTQRAPVNAAIDQRILCGLKRVHSFADGPPGFWDTGP